MLIITEEAAKIPLTDSCGAPPDRQLWCTNLVKTVMMWTICLDEDDSGLEINETSILDGNDDEIIRVYSTKLIAFTLTLEP